MSWKATGNRTEPIRTRKVSKSENKKVGQGDIQSAFKMAAEKRVNSQTAIRESKDITQPTNNVSCSQVSVANKHGQQSPLNVNKAAQRNEIATQITPIELEPTRENTSKPKEIGVSIDSSKEQILDALKELSEKYQRLEEAINDPQNGMRVNYLV